MPVSRVTPRRWHDYIVDLEPRTGTKPGKQRPCLAIQPTEPGDDADRGAAHETVTFLRNDTTLDDLGCFVTPVLSVRQRDESVITRSASHRARRDRQG